MSVQAVIAALNQQSNQTEIHPNYKINPSLKRSSTKNASSTSTTTDLASLRNRFNNNSNDHELIKKKTSTSTLKEINITKNEKSSTSTNSTNNNIKVANKYRTDKSFNTENKDSKLLTLEKQLEKVTLERDSLQQQLSQCHCHYNSNNNNNNTPYNSGSMVSHDENCSSNQLWFEVNQDDINSDDCDYEELITHYHQTTSQSISNYRQQIDQLKRQLAACEIGTQWMMGKYLGELERERLHTKSLKTIVQSQETLIHTMENNYKHNSTPSSSSTLPSSFSTSSMASITSNHHHSQQQYFLLRSQVDLQKMELDDQQDIIHMLMEERELLIKKLNHKSIHLHQQKRRSRAISSSSSTSTSSISSSSSSSMPVRPYSPPHTPPPFDRLPALPTSSSFSSTISSISTTTEPITPPSSQRPSMITFDHKPIIHEYNNNDDENEYENEIGHNKKINDFPPPQRQSSLLHKSSMPDIRSIHYSSLNSPRTSLGQHPSSMDPYLLLSSKKSLSRQRSFWKGWKQRLSN